MAKIQDVLKVHHTAVDANGEERIIRSLPYIRMSGEYVKGVLYLKQGHVVDDNGIIQDPIPSWIWVEASKCSDAALREVGFSLLAVQKLNDQDEPIDEPEDDAEASEDSDKVPAEPKAKPKGFVRTRRSGRGS